MSNVFYSDFSFVERLTTDEKNLQLEKEYDDIEYHTGHFRPVIS